VLEFTLQIEPKQGLGSSVSRRIRSEGLIPAVLYQRGEQSVPAVLNSREFIKIAAQAKTSQVFRSKSSVGELNDRSLLVKEVQRDFIKGSVLHVDFQLLRDDEEIIVEIPLTFVGEALGVKIDNGILTYVAHEIEISCLPKLIPDKIDINIAELRLGESIHGRDIVLPKGVKLVGNPDNTIVSIVASRPDDSAAPAASTDATAAAATPAAAAPAADKAKK
jgi:large subunit ribosomal protein L25